MSLNLYQCTIIKIKKKQNINKKSVANKNVKKRQGNLKKILRKPQVNLKKTLKKILKNAKKTLSKP